MLTPCAHLMCRDCLLSTLGYYKSVASCFCVLSGAHEVSAPRRSMHCPVCRQAVDKKDIIYLPGTAKVDEEPVGKEIVDISAQWRGSTKIDRLLTELSEIVAWNREVVAGTDSPAGRGKKRGKRDEDGAEDAVTRYPLAFSGGASLAALCSVSVSFRHFVCAAPLSNLCSGDPRTSQSARGVSGLRWLSTPAFAVFVTSACLLHPL